MAYYILKKLSDKQKEELLKKMEEDTATELEKAMFHHCYNLQDSDPIVMALDGYAY